MNWLRRFMIGRYGPDQLSMALILFTFILTFIGQMTRLPLLVYISYIPFGLSIFRILSRNFDRRRRENYRFISLANPVISWFKRTVNRVRYAKTRRYFKCPKCRTTMWVPKGKGKIVITCPKCGNEFRERT